jgi:hypothetical protein
MGSSPVFLEAITREQERRSYEGPSEAGHGDLGGWPPRKEGLTNMSIDVAVDLGTPIVWLGTSWGSIDMSIEATMPLSTGTLIVFFGHRALGVHRLETVEDRNRNKNN